MSLQKVFSKSSAMIMSSENVITVEDNEDPDNETDSDSSEDTHQDGVAAVKEAIITEIKPPTAVESSPPASPNKKIKTILLLLFLLTSASLGLGIWTFLKNAEFTSSDQKQREQINLIYSWIDDLQQESNASTFLIESNKNISDSRIQQLRTEKNISDSKIQQLRTEKNISDSRIHGLELLVDSLNASMVNEVNNGKIKIQTLQQQVSNLQAGEGFNTSLGLQVRLLGGFTRSYGAVQLRYNGRTGMLCDDQFDLNNNGAIVVCRMLGYKTGVYEDGNHYQPTWNKGPARYTHLYLMLNVKCTGSETDLTQCSHEFIPPGALCGNGELAGVRCIE